MQRERATLGSGKRLRAACALLVVCLCTTASAWSRDIYVKSSSDLVRAVAEAEPGDKLRLQPGVYQLHTVEIARGGREDAPITLIADDPKETIIETGAVELFKVRAPFWRFEGLDIRGTDKTHHAFHLVEAAHNTVIRRNRMVNFHATIKGNPERGTAPNDVIIDYNLLFNETPRSTRAPVTLIDVVGGDRWSITRNYIADFAKDGGDHISYGAFLKGGGKEGLFEGNLVNCEWRHTDGRRVGLSFGGGGTFQCYDHDCRPEHIHGVLKNNIVMNCSQAPGIYLNQSAATRVHHNTIYRSFGISLRFPLTSADISNNIISGAVQKHEGASAQESANLESGLAWGAYLPGGSERAIRRVSDYHRKYPNWFDKADVHWLQRKIEAVSNWMATTFIGRGDGQFTDWFEAPALGVFTLRDGGQISGRSTLVSDVTTDFCGRDRPTTRRDVGAIEYSSGDCDLERWLADALAPFDKIK